MKMSAARRLRSALSAMHSGAKSSVNRGVNHREREHLWWVSGTVSTFAAAIFLSPMIAPVAFIGAAFLTDMAVGQFDETEEVER